MSTSAVVNKLTKVELTGVLKENFKAVSKASKDLAGRIMYASKKYKEDEKSVTKKDLLDLVKETMTVLGSKFILSTESKVVPLVENSVKPSGKKLSKKSKETEETEEPVEEEAPKKTTKKTPKKKESAVKVANEDEENTPATLLAETFKEEIMLSDDGESKYQIAHDIDSIEKLVEAFNNEETIVFAMYWSKRHLKQFPYFNGEFEAPKEFPMDLDVASCIYVSDDNVVAYAVSLYTEGCYMFKPQDFEEYEGIRFSGSIEYQIYRLVE